MIARVRAWWDDRSLRRLHAGFEQPKSRQNLLDEAAWWERRGEPEMGVVCRGSADAAHPLT